MEVAERLIHIGIKVPCDDYRIISSFFLDGLQHIFCTSISHIFVALEEAANRTFYPIHNAFTCKLLGVPPKAQGNSRSLDGSRHHIHSFHSQLKTRNRNTTLVQNILLCRGTNSIALAVDAPMRVKLPEAFATAVRQLYPGCLISKADLPSICQEYKRQNCS